MRRHRAADLAPHSPAPESTWYRRGGQPLSSHLLSRPPGPPIRSQVCALYASTLVLNDPPWHAPQTAWAAGRIFHTNSFHASFVLLKKKIKLPGSEATLFSPFLLAYRRHLGCAAGNGRVLGWEKLLGEWKVRCGPF